MSDALATAEAEIARLTALLTQTERQLDHETRQKAAVVDDTLTIYMPEVAKLRALLAEAREALADPVKLETHAAWLDLYDVRHQGIRGKGRAPCGMAVSTGDGVQADMRVWANRTRALLAQFTTAQQEAPDA